MESFLKKLRSMKRKVWGFLEIVTRPDDCIDFDGYNKYLEKHKKAVNKIRSKDHDWK